MAQDPEPDERIARSGVHGLYRWLTVGGDVYMGEVVGLVPEAIVHHHVAITSYDSGVFRLSEQEISEGWVLEGEIAYSPRITTTESLRFQRDGLDSPGYDEWYVFTEPPPSMGTVYRGNYFEFQPGSSQFMVFVNSPAFLVHEANPYLPGILDLFWEQLQRIRPTTFIADGRDCVTIVSLDHALVQAAETRLLDAPSH